VECLLAAGEPVPARPPMTTAVTTMQATAWHHQHHAKAGRGTALRLESRVACFWGSRGAPLLDSHLSRVAGSNSVVAIAIRPTLFPVCSVPRLGLGTENLVESHQGAPDDRVGVC
jgi:hypothetical protein